MAIATEERIDQDETQGCGRNGKPTGEHFKVRGGLLRKGAEGVKAAAGRGGQGHDRSNCTPAWAGATGWG